jgi:Spy/CpxP family protein refolding chaperone
MWQKLRKLLVILSVSLNVAIFAAWLWHSVSMRPGDGLSWRAKEAKTAPGIWCPLHRQLGVNKEQWRRIEPRIVRFRAEAQGLRQKMDALRMNMVDLIAAHQVDQKAVDAKRDEIHAAQAMMQKLVIGHLIAEKELLTPDQQKMLFGMIRTRCICSEQGPLLGTWPGSSEGPGQLLRKNPDSNRDPKGKKP